MIDTHAHLYFEQYDLDRSAVIGRCHEKLRALINVGIDIKTSQAALDLALQNDFMFASIGIHPEEVDSIIKDFGSISAAVNELILLITPSSTSKIVAIGEAGLDYHSELILESSVALQKELFRSQLELALEHNLPVIIHSREATPDTLEILNDFANTTLKGVWHSFTGDSVAAQQVLNTNLFIGINGISTYPSAKLLREAITQIPHDRLVLETDAPFLAPQSYRGQRNESWMVELVANTVGECWGISPADVISKTDTNALSLFAIQ
ncbi:TatD family hydrolase [candidate division WWE3 bacterium]|nr:TatD family hydrolase [candidate division WWE3 bacterium]